MTIPVDPPRSDDERLSALKHHFESVWGGDTTNGFFFVSVPLRVCPIGAHSDHQGGTITGLTIDRTLLLLGKSTATPELSVFSANFCEQRDASYSNIPAKVPGDWGNYLRGTAQVFKERGAPIRRGFRAVVEGAMPIGGLSSSAAVTIAYLSALARVNSVELSTQDAISCVRSVENGYLGLRNGIMDQSVILSGRKNALTCVDCSNLQITSLSQPPTAQPWEILVVYSGLSRQLTGTPFNQRVSECHEAARELLTMAGMDAPKTPLLGEAGAELFQRYGDKLPQNLYRRAQHFFSERERVHRGMGAWERGDLTEFGSLVTQSGESSIVNFESGSPALISLYEVLREIQGVYGARFCGGGFQGCCLALIDPGRRDRIVAAVHEGYMKRHPELAGSYSIHLCSSSDSVQVGDVE